MKCLSLLLLQFAVSVLKGPRLVLNLGYTVGKRGVLKSWDLRSQRSNSVSRACPPGTSYSLLCDPGSFLRKADSGPVHSLCSSVPVAMWPLVNRKMCCHNLLSPKTCLSTICPVHRLWLSKTVSQTDISSLQLCAMVFIIIRQTWQYYLSVLAYI